MEKSSHNEATGFTPFIISLAIHVLLFSLLFTISYINYYYTKLKSSQESARDVDIESIAISPDEEMLQTGPDRDAGRTNGTGPNGLNDSAGRELWKTARSGISVTPDNFLEYAKIRNMRKGLNVKPGEDVYEKYPFLKGSGHFDMGFGHKLKTDFQDCYEDVCRIIDLGTKERASPEDEPEKFTAAVLDYLAEKRAVRTWRTLWMAPKPATLHEKIVLVRLLRRLHNYGIEGENAGYEHMRNSIKSLIDLIPDELKFPAARSN